MYFERGLTLLAPGDCWDFNPIPYGVRLPPIPYGGTIMPPIQNGYKCCVGPKNDAGVLVGWKQ